MKLISMVSGFIYDSKLSKSQIKSFIKTYWGEDHISDFLSETSKFVNTEWNTNYKNFNDFFSRKFRNIDLERPLAETKIVFPSDGKYSILSSEFDYNQSPDVYLKGSKVTYKELISQTQNPTLRNGDIIIIYLSPTDYHRFHMPCNGKICKIKHIKGTYLSVNETAVKSGLPIYYKKCKDCN